MQYVLNSKLLHPKPEIVKNQLLKQFYEEAFLEDLSKVPFSAAYIFDDPDDVYWCAGKKCTIKFWTTMHLSFRSSNVKHLVLDLLHVTFEKSWTKKSVQKEVQ